MMVCGSHLLKGIGKQINIVSAWNECWNTYFTPSMPWLTCKAGNKWLGAAEIVSLSVNYLRLPKVSAMHIVASPKTQPLAFSHVTAEAVHTYLICSAWIHRHCGQLHWSWECFIRFAYIISFLHCLELNSELALKSQLSAFMHLFFRLLLDTFMRVDWWLLADLLNLSGEKEARDPYLYIWYN